MLNQFDTLINYFFNIENHCSLWSKWIIFSSSVYLSINVLIYN